MVGKIPASCGKPIRRGRRRQTQALSSGRFFQSCRVPCLAAPFLAISRTFVILGKLLFPPLVTQTKFCGLNHKSNNVEQPFEIHSQLFQQCHFFNSYPQSTTSFVHTQLYDTLPARSSGTNRAGTDSRATSRRSIMQQNTVKPYRSGVLPNSRSQRF